MGLNVVSGEALVHREKMLDHGGVLVREPNKLLFIVINIRKTLRWPHKAIFFIVTLRDGLSERHDSVVTFEREIYDGYVICRAALSDGLVFESWHTLKIDLVLG